MKRVFALLSIIAMVCAFAIPAAFADDDGGYSTYTLTVVSSNPSSGVPITVSPNDRDGRGNGTTEFTRRYNSGVSVTLTAPATPVVSGKTYYFQKWQRNSVDYTTNRTATLTISANVRMTAVYTSTPPTTTSYTLTVASSNPASGVAVTVSPADRNGQSNGTTQFTRSYNSGTAVTLTAPATAGGNNFQKWQKNGVDAGTAQAVSVTVTANTTMTAVYVTPPPTSYTLTVASSNPASGVAVTVSPVDNSGQGNGTTQFTRSYNSGAVVALTAPATAGGNNFQKWQKNGVDAGTTQSVSATMTANTTMTAVYVAPPTTAYTLTVASSNPASGVAVTVSPVDNSGQGNGTTQFTRSYNSGAAVTLTAPATAGGNNFQKWQKNGVDAGTAQTTSVTMTANTTMTAVYATPGTTHSGLTWTGYAMCASCHADKAAEVQASQHYKWEGAAPYMVNGAAVQGKLKTAVNSYCGNIIGNWGCSMCHVGIGKRPDDATLTQQQHLENIDCLICHQKNYKRKKDTLTGLMVPDTLNMTITMDQAVQTVHLPVRQNCTQCHAKGGGGDNFKRGDLAVAHGTTADRNFDVHMASSATGNLVCQKCHTVQQHKIAGRGSDLRQTDLDVKVTCSTSTCHPTKTTSTGHTTMGVYKHVARVACQTCHIPKSAKNAADTAATEATEMNRDWSVPEWSVTNNRWEPTVTLVNDIKPQYKFWNGTSWGYSLKDPAAIDPATGKYPTSRPVGTIAGTDSSKIFPFKYKTAHRPYATNLGILIPVETKTYFAGAGTVGGVDAAIQSSLTLMGYSNAEPYTWVDDDTYQLLTHEVPPATGNVLACTNCHISTTATQMNLQNLGYALKKPTSDLCNDCHSLQSYTSSYSNFTSIHSRHVDSQQRKCSNCHNFDRPERTNLH